MPDLNAPLAESELDQLADFLDGLPSPTAMNIERLDGFLCALVAGPELVTLSEYLPKVIGAGADESPAFDSIEQAREIMNLLTRHWNTIASTLRAGTIYLPILLLDPTSVSRGHDWAKGFVDGIAMRAASWRGLINDETNGGIVIPMLALAHEDDLDPQLHFATPTAAQREEMLHLMTGYLVRIYQHFEKERARHATEHVVVAPQSTTRSTPKIGRNDACHCGSGKKFKHCCLARMH